MRGTNTSFLPADGSRMTHRRTTRSTPSRTRTRRNRKLRRSQRSLTSTKTARPSTASPSSDHRCQHPGEEVICAVCVCVCAAVKRYICLIVWKTLYMGHLYLSLEHLCHGLYACNSLCAEAWKGHWF